MEDVEIYALYIPVNRERERIYGLIEYNEVTEGSGFHHFSPALVDPDIQHVW